MGPDHVVGLGGVEHGVVVSDEHRHRRRHPAFDRRAADLHRPLPLPGDRHQPAAAAGRQLDDQLQVEQLLLPGAAAPLFHSFPWRAGTNQTYTLA